MAVARFAALKPTAGSDGLLYVIQRTALTSIVAVNIGGTTTISAWIVPDGEGSNEESWIYYIDGIALSNRNTFETFKIAVNPGDTLYVRSETGDVTFFANGIYDVSGRANVTTGAAEPESPQIGDVWINDDVDPKIVKYWEGTAWLEVGIVGPQGPTGPQGEIGPTGPQGTFDVFDNAPATPDEGDVWFNSSDGRFYVYYDSYWVEALSNEAGPTGATGPTGPSGGPIGPTGPATSISVNTTTGLPGTNAAVSVTGPAGNQIVSFVVPQGPTGPTGGQTIISVTGPLTVTGPIDSRTVGIVVGVNGVQGYDADLAAIGNLTTPASTAFLKEDSSGVWSLDTTTYAPLAGATFTGTVTGPGFSSTGPVSGSTGTFSAAVSALNYNVSVQTALASTGTVALDFLTQGFKSHTTLTGNITYTASNYTAGRTLTIRVVNGTTIRNLTFPTSWVFLGTRPTSIAASRTGILTVNSFGTTEADCVAAWSVQV